MLSRIPVNSSKFKIDVRVFSWVFPGTTQNGGKVKKARVPMQKGVVSGI